MLLKYKTYSSYKNNKIDVLFKKKKKKKQRQRERDTKSQQSGVQLGVMTLCPRW